VKVLVLGATGHVGNALARIPPPISGKKFNRKTSSETGRAAGQYDY